MEDSGPARKVYKGFYLYEQAIILISHQRMSPFHADFHRLLVLKVSKIHITQNMNLTLWRL